MNSPVATFKNPFAPPTKSISRVHAFNCSLVRYSIFIYGALTAVVNDIDVFSYDSNFITISLVLPDVNCDVMSISSSLLLSTYVQIPLMFTRPLFDSALVIYNVALAIL